MEVGFWRCLFGDDDSRLVLRQRAPEVIIFRGCRLEAWYHSTANGLFVRRVRNVCIQSAMDCLLRIAQSASPDAVSGEGLDPNAPAAILRRRGAGAIGLDSHRGLSDVPMATMLTVQELTEIFQRAQNGIEGEEADIWSVQSLVSPADDVRVLCAYNCDSMGVERNDIFGRRYETLYNTLRSRDTVVPFGGAVLVDDQCLPVASDQRAVVEAKTLGIVRFASRFHALELEGIVLEFVFDSKDNCVLHGCWCAAVFGPEVKRKFRSGSLAGRGGGPAPRVFPVPAPSSRPRSATPSMARAVSSSTGSEAGRSDFARDREPVGTGGGVRDTSRAAPSEVASERGCGESAKGDGPAEVARSHDAAFVLLEVWRGEDFLGEAVVNCSIDDQRLRLCPAGVSDPAGRTRADRRKEADGAPSAEDLERAWVHVGASWRYVGDAQTPLLSFSLWRAEGLPPPRAASPGLRALLWLQRHSSDIPPWSSKQFSPLWGSAVAGDAADGTAASWEESVELRMEDGPGRGSPEIFAEGVPWVQKNYAPDADPESGVDGWDIRGRPIELKKVLRSARDQVCGAHWNAHWGNCAEDGTMRGSALATQVCQRWGMDRLNRSHLLSQLSYHVDQFSDLQQAWEAEIAQAQEAISAKQGLLETERLERTRIRNETAGIVQEQEKRMAETCRQMCSVLDDHRIAEYMDNVALEQSKQRISEQRTIVHQLIDKGHGLQSSLDRTVRQFDELSSSYAQVQGEMLRAQVLRPRTVHDLDDSIGQAQLIREEVAEEESNLAGLRGKMMSLQDELVKEREASLRLEEFVRKIARGPAARLRTGGGFQLDRTAKSEAIAMLDELRALQAAADGMARDRQLELHAPPS